MGIRDIRKTADKIQKDLRDFIIENLETKIFFVCPLCDKKEEYEWVIIDHLLDDHKWDEVMKKIKQEED